MLSQPVGRLPNWRRTEKLYGSRFSLADLDYIKQVSAKYETDYRNQGGPDAVLTHREFQVWWLLLHEARPVEIAKLYNVTPKAIEKSWSRIQSKMNDWAREFRDKRFKRLK